MDLRLWKNCGHIVCFLRQHPPFTQACCGPAIKGNYDTDAHCGNLATLRNSRADWRNVTWAARLLHCTDTTENRRLVCSTRRYRSRSKIGPGRPELVPRPYGE